MYDSKRSGSAQPRALHYKVEPIVLPYNVPKSSGNAQPRCFALLVA